ncbi:prolipoprotein diacylglyceryl transferase family protein [Mycobacterium sp. B14F4]|uniref:prolipoprotein diacylglyceryl transferase n=1 Tax=Mycobacterium sp. B14F4 TaxID=3153565 RepID=UPI00325DFADD
MTAPQRTHSSRWLGRPYLFSVGRFRVSSYAALLYLGFVLGTVGGAWETGLDNTRFAACAVVLLVPALLGGRLWYLAQHGRTTSGAGLYGGLVLSFLLSWPVVRLAGLDFWRFWDGAAVVLLVGMIVTRFGCLMTGCCAGRETQGSWGVWLPDSSGEWKRRYPTQLLESGVSAMILVVGLALYTPSGPPGVLFFGSAAAYGCARVVLESLRADAHVSARSTRMNVAFSALLATGALIALLLTR